MSDWTHEEAGAYSTPRDCFKIKAWVSLMSDRIFLRVVANRQESLCCGWNICTTAPVAKIGLTPSESGRGFAGQ